MTATAADVAAIVARLDILEEWMRKAELKATLYAEDIEELRTMLKKDSKHKERDRFVIDKRDLPKPDIFLGNRDVFIDWKNAIEDLGSTYGTEVRELMEWAGNRRDEISKEDLDEWAKDKNYDNPDNIKDCLNTILSGYTKATPKRIVRGAKGNGAEAWRRLITHYNPNTSFNEAALQSKLTNPPPAEGLEQVLDAIEQWEETERLYQELTGEELPERLRRGALMTICPPVLADWLKMNSRRLGGSYKEVKDEITGYIDLHVSSTRGNDAAMPRMPSTIVKKAVNNVDELQEQADWQYDYSQWNPMELDAIKAAGGKKGKGKGKGFEGKCWTCGGNHRQSECEQHLKGYGKADKGGKASAKAWGKGAYGQGKGYGMINEFQPYPSQPQQMQQHFTSTAIPHVPWSPPASAWTTPTTAASGGGQQPGPVQLGGLSFICELSNSFAELSQDAHGEGETSMAEPTVTTCVSPPPMPTRARIGRKARKQEQRKRWQKFDMSPDGESDDTARRMAFRPCGCIGSQCGAERANASARWPARSNQDKDAMDNPEPQPTIQALEINQQIYDYLHSGDIQTVSTGDWVDIAVDSGAAESVLPEEWIKEYPLLQTDRSQQAVFATASGEKIQNRGERQPVIRTAEGHVRGMRFQCTRVKRPLASITRMAEANHTVVFDSAGSYIVNKSNGEVTTMRPKNGLFVIEAQIMQPPVCNEQGFARLGATQ